MSHTTILLPTTGSAIRSIAKKTATIGSWVQSSKLTGYQLIRSKRWTVRRCCSISSAIINLRYLRSATVKSSAGLWASLKPKRCLAVSDERLDTAAASCLKKATNVPVSIGGSVIAPGDIVVGDEDGVVSFPSSMASTLLEAVRGQIAREEETIISIREGRYGKS
jgi:hypothetical protein